MNWVNFSDNLDDKSFIYNWVVPNTSSQTCKVRFTDLDNPANTDESDAYFTINSSTFVPSMNEELAVSIFPNLLSDKFFLADLKSTNTLNVAFYDTLGKLIHQSSVLP